MFGFTVRVSLLICALALVAPVSGFAEEDPVVASVNGEEIHRSDVEDARRRLPERFSEVPLEAVYGLLVNSLVDSKLVAAEARKVNLHKDEGVLKQMKRIEEQVLERTFLLAFIEKRITQDALKAEYEKVSKEAAVKEEVHARHILLETEAEAKEVIKELQGGADFAELAKARSKGPSGAEGGDLGYFAEGQMVPAFSDASFAMKSGEVSKKPVQTQFGWHVIKIEGRRTVQPPTLEEMEPELRMTLSREIGSAFLKELRKSAEVERFNLDGSAMKEPAQ